MDSGMKLRSLPEQDGVLNLRNILIVFVVGGGLYCYSGVFLSLVKQWRSNEIYSHGFLIPFISLYLVHFKRDSIAEIRLAPSYAAGVPALVFALFCLLAGRIAGILVLEEISIVLTISSILLLLFGRKLLRVVWLPVLYLLLMIPMWDFFTDRIQLPFQLLSATIGVDLLNRIGIPIYHNGIYIELPGITLEVAKACSGVNYLISILAIGIPLSYINTRRNFRRFLILFSSIVIALLSNGIRVFLVGLFVYKGILGKGHDIHGPFHILQALSVSFVGYLVVFALVWLLKDEIPPFRMKGKTSLAVERGILNHLRDGPLAICAILLAVVSGGLAYTTPRPLPLKKDFGQFPYRVGGWEGRGERFDLVLNCGANADHKLYRVYQTGDSLPVKLYIGYYAFQKQGKELIDYRCDHFFDGGNSIELAIDKERTIKVNRYLINGRHAKTSLLYWVQEGDRLFHDKYAEKYHMMTNALLHRRSNGAIVVVSMDIADEKESGREIELQMEFVRHIYPLLESFLP